MNFIYLPLNNLYKFLFWSGLLLIAFSFYLKQKTTDNLYVELYKQDSITNGLMGDKAVLTTYLEYLERTAERNRSSAGFEKKLLEAKSDLEKKQVELNNATSKEKRLNQKYESTGETVKTLYIIGLIAFSLGGFAWLFKVQIPQENIISMQKKLLELELEEKLSPSYRFKHLSNLRVRFRNTRR